MPPCMAGERMVCQTRKFSINLFDEMKTIMRNEKHETSAIPEGPDMRICCTVDW